MLYVIGRKVESEFVYLRSDWKEQKEAYYTDNVNLAEVFEEYAKAEKECSSDEIPLPVTRDEDGKLSLV